MTFSNFTLAKNKQLLVLSLWLAFIGLNVWLHALQSHQPPIHDAASYYQKAYEFWNKVHQGKFFNPFNVSITFRPPGTILMSYPFGFDTDFRGFYFRSTFLPIALLCLAVMICGYRHEMDNKGKWHLVLLAAFLSALPCFYSFEVAQNLPASLYSYWGLVDNFLAGVAAVASSALVRSILTRSYLWLGLAAFFSSFCLLIKPTGILIMMLIGLTWFGITALQLKSVWQSPDERRSTIRWLMRGMIFFAFPYLTVIVLSVTSQYLSSQNLAFGNAAIVIMQTELVLTWAELQRIIHVGLGYPFFIWLILMFTNVGHYLLRSPNSYPLPWLILIGLMLAFCITLAFGVWFWIFGSGGANQIRYFIPFLLVGIIFAAPALLATMRQMQPWKMTLLSTFMIAPIINIGLLLPQKNPSIDWQKWSGINLTSGIQDPILKQAQDFITKVEREGRSANYYSMPMNDLDGKFQSVIDYARIVNPTGPAISTSRPVDWLRPTTYRKEEMLNADYWLFQPIQDSQTRNSALATPLVNDLNQEILLFQAWATQLTKNHGVIVISETPRARIIRIVNPTLLELEFDTFVAKHQWRRAFISANPKRRYSEKEVMDKLSLSSPSLENVNFSDRFYLRALSVSCKGNEITVHFWWKPLVPIAENDWILYIHLFDKNKNKVVLATGAPIRFNRSSSTLEGAFLYDQFTFTKPARNGLQQLGIGFVRPNQVPLLADKGIRDWENRRIILPIP